jgi:hypothetical protein
MASVDGYTINLVDACTSCAIPYVNDMFQLEHTHEYNIVFVNDSESDVSVRFEINSRMHGPFTILKESKLKLPKLGFGFYINGSGITNKILAVIDIINLNYTGSKCNGYRKLKTSVLYVKMGVKDR